MVARGGEVMGEVEEEQRGEVEVRSAVGDERRTEESSGRGRRSGDGPTVQGRAGHERREAARGEERRMATRGGEERVTAKAPDGRRQGIEPGAWEHGERRRTTTRGGRRG